MPRAVSEHLLKISAVIISTGLLAVYICSNDAQVIILTESGALVDLSFN